MRGTHATVHMWRLGESHLYMGSTHVTVYMWRLWDSQLYMRGTHATAYMWRLGTTLRESVFSIQQAQGAGVGQQGSLLAEPSYPPLAIVPCISTEQHLGTEQAHSKCLDKRA